MRCAVEGEARGAPVTTAGEREGRGASSQSSGNRPGERHWSVGSGKEAIFRDRSWVGESMEIERNRW